MELLGIVQRGMQIGAFALLSTGAYAQINGDIVQSPNAARVKLAMRHDGIQHYVDAILYTAKAEPPPKITIKKRRCGAPW